jgi:hypothetical protein
MSDVFFKDNIYQLQVEIIYKSLSDTSISNTKQKLFKPNYMPKSVKKKISTTYLQTTLIVLEALLFVRIICYSSPKVMRYKAQIYKGKDRKSYVLL